MDAANLEEMFDLLHSGKMENAFFAEPEALPAAEGRLKKRRKKASLLVQPQRKPAFLQLKILDKILRTRLGHGLEANLWDANVPFSGFLAVAKGLCY